MPGLAHNCRWHRIHEGTVSSFAFAYRGAKVRISEQNAKGKFVFLFIFEREYLRCSQRYSKNRRKTSLDALFSLFLTIWYGDNILTQNGEQFKFGNDRYVFDIKGNNYRIVAVVLFINKKVYMRFVGTHEEYEKIKDIKNI